MCVCVCVCYKYEKSNHALHMRKYYIIKFTVHFFHFKKVYYCEHIHIPTKIHALLIFTTVNIWDRFREKGLSTCFSNFQFLRYTRSLKCPLHNDSYKRRIELSVMELQGAEVIMNYTFNARVPVLLHVL